MMLSRKTSNLLPQGRPAYAGLPCGGRGGFTLVELVVSIAIFTIMTALVVAKYGNFNNSLLLTNLAYDVAGTIRTAQTYGLSVKSTGSEFSNGYAVHFRMVGATSTCRPSVVNSTTFAMISESNMSGSGACDPGDDVVKTYKLVRGAQILSVCVGPSEGACTNSPEGDIAIHFRRPNPDAEIYISCTQSYCTGGDIPRNYARIVIGSPDGSTRSVSVRSNGQISVGD